MGNFLFCCWKGCGDGDDQQEAADATRRDRTGALLSDLQAPLIDAHEDREHDLVVDRRPLDHDSHLDDDDDDDDEGNPYQQRQKLQLIEAFRKFNLPFIWERLASMRKRVKWDRYRFSRAIPQLYEFHVSNPNEGKVLEQQCEAMGYHSYRKTDHDRILVSIREEHYCDISLLHLACEYLLVHQLISYLQEEGRCKTIRLRTFGSAIHLHLVPKILQLMLESADSVVDQDSVGYSCLHLLAKHGDIELMLSALRQTKSSPRLLKQLLAQDGSTPFSIATQYNHSLMVQLAHLDVATI